MNVKKILVYVISLPKIFNVIFVWILEQIEKDNSKSEFRPTSK